MTQSSCTRVPTLGPTVISFDIGGTWFRSAIYTPTGEIRESSRRPAVNYLNTPGVDAKLLQEQLVQFLVTEARRLRALAGEAERMAAGVSLGAAMHANTGHVWGAGPLWGAHAGDFHLHDELTRRAPEFSWTVVNDVTAALLRHAQEQHSPGLQKLTLITVSSGIGARTINLVDKSIPVDPVCGLQGEIGHIPIRFIDAGTTIDLICDCGGDNHLNAFASGRGLQQLLPILAARDLHGFRNSLLAKLTDNEPAALSTDVFAQAVEADDPFACQLLRKVTRPLAEIIHQQLVWDPQIDMIILTGGVAVGLGTKYMASVIEHLDQLGLYMVSDQDPQYFHRIITMGAADDQSGLIGAGIAARDAAGPLLPPATTQAPQWTVTASMPVTYSIYETHRLFAQDNEVLLDTILSISNPPRALVFLDNAVAQIHMHDIATYLERHGVESRLVTLPCSEAHKTVATLQEVLTHFATFQLGRQEPAIAIGGGVLMDVIGLAASMYRRGVPYIRIPTTLVGLIDASVGVKTAVNFGAHKNRLGTYAAPAAVILDRSFLQTLTARHLRTGLAEMLKVALVRDAALFKLIEHHGEELIRTKFQEGGAAPLTIHRAIDGMLAELEPNLWEKQLDRLMDFGHTFSPALEMAAGADLEHGEAVALDMALCLIISAARGRLSARDLERALRVMRQLGLPTFHPLCHVDLLWQALNETTIHRGGRQRVALPGPIGAARFVNDLTRSEVSQAIQTLQNGLLHAPAAVA